MKILKQSHTDSNQDLHPGLPPSPAWPPLRLPSSVWIQLLLPTACAFTTGLPHYPLFLGPVPFQPRGLQIQVHLGKGGIDVHTLLVVSGKGFTFNVWRVASALEKRAALRPG